MDIVSDRKLGNNSGFLIIFLWPQAWLHFMGFIQSLEYYRSICNIMTALISSDDRTVDT